MISRFQFNGVQRLFLFKSLYQYSTSAVPAQPTQTNFLVDYLINSLGFSKDEALSATKTVILWNSSRNDPDLVVNFFQKLGLNNAQIRSIISAYPRLLACNVDKTLQPKVLALQELGISGSALISILVNYKSLLARGLRKRPIEYLRSLLGSDENVAEAIKKYGSVLDTWAPKMIEANVELLQKHGLSKEYVSRFMLENPRCFMQKPEWLEEVLYMVENAFQIPRESKMFYHGVLAISSVSKTTMDTKLGVLRSFGLSDVTIYSMIKQFPNILKTSEDKMRKIWNFFTKEIGCTPDFLASHPVVFNLSLEKRVIPRYEVLKILDEKKLSKRKPGLYTVLCISESNFVDGFLFRYKDEIPDILDFYFKIVGREKTGKL
jgi:mTERF domain-containing protein, mitochondrial